MVGASMWQGPHQSAHMSSSTGVALSLDFVRECRCRSLRRARRQVRAAASCTCRRRALRPGCMGGSRFVVPHDGHVMRRSVMAFTVEI